jgi:hypothetical protein
VHVDLPEARELLSDLLVRENADAERRLAFDILVERNLGARQQTDRNMRLPDRGEAAGATGACCRPDRRPRRAIPFSSRT